MGLMDSVEAHASNIAKAGEHYETELTSLEKAASEMEFASQAGDLAKSKLQWLLSISHGVKDDAMKCSEKLRLYAEKVEYSIIEQAKIALKIKEWETTKEIVE